MMSNFKSVIIFVFLFQFGYGNCQNKSAQLAFVRSGYADSLQKMMKVIKEGENPKIKSIEFCFPLTNSESSLFYQLDYNPETSKSFGTLENKIKELAHSGNQTILRKYLMLSEFVDGYFAEVYFEDIEGLIEKNPELFCKTVKALPTQKTLRLSEAKKKSGCL